MKIRKENLLMWEIICFPIIYILFALFLKNNYMRIFYIVYFLLFFATKMRNGFSLQKKLICILFLIIPKWLYDYLVHPDFISDALLLGICFILMFIYDDKDLQDHYFQFIKRYSSIIAKLYLVYYLALVYSILFGDGLTNEWGTISVQGPYGLAHILSYELMVIGVNSFLCYKKTKKKYWIVYIILTFCFILATTVRTTVLSVAVLIVFYYISQKGLKKVLYAIAGGLCSWLALSYTNIFNTIIEKTNNAILNGSITNYRSKIWISSYTLFEDCGLINKLFGNGMSNLFEWNLKHLGMDIQAHNDFLTVLIAFGIFALFMYLFLLLNFSKGKGQVAFLASIFVLIFFNGLYSYCSFVIGLIPFRIMCKEISE